MGLAKILVGTDFSKESDAAVNQGIAIARHTGAEVTLLFAGAVPGNETSLPESLRTDDKRFATMVSDELAGARDKLQEIRARHDGQGVTISHMVIDALPDEGIARAAKELAVDVVVVGTHGRSGVRRLLLGSVAERLIRIVETNLLIARPPRGAHSGYRKILVPTDYSETAEKALRLAIDLAHKGAAIDLFHCWTLPATAARGWDPLSRSVTDPIRKDLSAHAIAEAQRLIDRHGSVDVSISFADCEDTPVHGIHQQLDNNDYDLVVMGSHGRSGLRRWLMGSVAEGTVRYAPTSVLIAHSDGDYGELS